MTQVAGFACAEYSHYCTAEHFENDENTKVELNLPGIKIINADEKTFEDNEMYTFYNF